jgi:hypothetical protein
MPRDALLGSRRSWACLLASTTLVRARRRRPQRSRGRWSTSPRRVVPDVRVTIVNLETGLQRFDCAPKREERSLFRCCRPALRRLTAHRDGFAATEIPVIVLNVGDAVDVEAASEKWQGVDASVSVTAEGPRVNTSPAVATVIDRTFVDNLPLNGRSFQTLDHAHARPRW